MTSAQGLDDTLTEFDTVVDRAWSERSALGIFPSMYRAVTIDIREGVRTGFFEDSAAIEELSVIFADRYFDAFADRIAGRQPSLSWQVAFGAATGGRRRMILQHLLAGMNAHINLDLGISTAEIAGDRPDRLHADFLRVNSILFQKVNGLQAYLNRVSPTMLWFDWLGGFLDEWAMRFAIGLARDRAWDLAMELVAHPDQGDAIVARRDRQTAQMGRVILGEQLPVRPVSWLITIHEPEDVRPVLESFLERPVDLERVEAAVQAERSARSALRLG